MARMHSRMRGRSSSTRPLSKRPPSWMKLTPDEVESLVVRYAKEGNSPSVIGVLLRDQHGVPLAKQATGRTVGEILRKHNIRGEVPEDLNNLVNKALRMYRHIQSRRSDKSNTHRLQLIQSKIRRLANYYKSVGRLPKDWSLTYPGVT